jgi:hypothetical protein
MSEGALAYLCFPTFGRLYLHELTTGETENNSSSPSNNSPSSDRIGRHVIGVGCLSLVQNIIRKLYFNYSARSQVQRVRRMVYSAQLHRKILGY